MFELSQEPAGDVTTTPPGTPKRRAGLPVEPSRLLTALQRSKKTLIVATVVGAVAGVILAKTVVPREYTAEATIMWEPGLAPIEEVKQEPRELRTLVESIKVHGNLAETRRRLELPTAVGDLGSRVSVTSTEKSNLVLVAATWSDAETAPKVANTLVDVFLEQRLAASRTRAEELHRDLTSDAETARRVLADARRAYDDFRKENGIADLPAETLGAIEQAAKLRAEADLSSAEAKAEEARAKALREAARMQPETTVLSTVEQRTQALKLAETEAELAAAGARLSGDHPKVLALKAQAEELRKSASQPGASVVAERVVGKNPQLAVIRQSLEVSMAQREAALKRQQALTELAASASERIAKLSVIEGRATELLSAVRVAEAHLDGLEKIRARAADAVGSPTTGFRVVDPALRPELPSKSKRRLFAMAAPIVALLLAMGYVLARALQGARVHTAREVAFWGDGPVVASSCWPAQARGLGDLASELWTFTTQTHGTTLVVPMSAAERNLAEKVGLCLSSSELTTDTDAERAAAIGRVWDGDEHGPEIRRAARLADRVLVVLSAGAHSAASLYSMHSRLGRTNGVGYVLLGVESDLAKLPDRAGDVGRFWRSGSPELSVVACEVSHA